MENPACRALRNGDAAEIRRFVRAMFDCELTDHEVASLCKKWGGRESRWTVSAGPAMWIKNRLCELGLFRLSRNLPPDIEQPTVTAVMHIFFLSLEETAAMMEILKNENQPEQKKRIAKVARSKLFGTPLVVTPVDSTAGKVAQMP